MKQHESRWGWIHQDISLSILSASRLGKKKSLPPREGVAIICNDSISLTRTPIHRIIEKWSWKGPTRPSSPNPSSMQEYNQSISARWLSKLFLNASSVGALTNSWGNWFHCRTALTVRKLFLRLNQNLASFNLSSLCPALWHDGEQILPLLCMTAF